MRRALNLLQGAFLLSGMIIGVGMFGIPFSFAQAGYAIGAIELFFLTFIILVYHLLYGEVVLATPAFHRMPGYVRRYLGDGAAALDWCIAVLGITGSLLAYALLGSLFLTSVLSSWVALPQPEAFILFLVAGILINILPLKNEVSISNTFTLLLLFLLALLVIVLLPHISAKNLIELYPVHSFMPYGVLLFALSGGVVIPDMVTFLGRRKRRVQAAIMLGTLIPAVLYGFFSLAIVGALGHLTTKDAMSGLMPIVGSPVVFLGSAIGLLATFNAFITLSESFESLLYLDLKFSRFNAQIIIAGLPLLLYLWGVNNYLGIMGAVGAFGVGIESVLVMLMYHVIQKRRNKTLSLSSYIWKITLATVVLVGVLGEIAHLAG